jgi:hypothetical protein
LKPQNHGAQRIYANFQGESNNVWLWKCGAIPIFVYQLLFPEKTRAHHCGQPASATLPEVSTLKEIAHKERKCSEINEI